MGSSPSVKQPQNLPDTDSPEIEPANVSKSNNRNIKVTVVKTNSYSKSAEKKPNQSFRSKMKANIKNDHQRVIKYSFISPQCMNGRQSTMVCLSNKCQSYPFYCLECLQNCEELHLHSSKTTSIGIKQFQNRVLTFPQLNPSLTDAIASYRSTLELFKQHISHYIEKEYQFIASAAKIKKLSAEAEQFKQNAEKSSFKGMKGSQLSKLWSEGNTLEKENQKARELEQKTVRINRFSNCFDMIVLEYEQKEKQP